VKIALLAGILLGMAALAAADLPVHCPHHTIKGAWKFDMSEGNKDKSLSCAKPANSNMCFYGSCYNNKVIGDATFKKDKSWKVSLADPNIALATDETGKQHKGTWTSVYDEGFEVDVSDRHFFAFSHFAKGKSQCKQTYPGWHRDAENPDKKAWGCYTGEKQSEKLHEEHLSLLSEEERAIHEDSMNLIEITEEDRSTIKAYDSPDPAREKPFEPEHELVKRINAKATTWKAKVYPEFEKHTVAEFNRLGGFRPATLPKEGHADVFLEEEVQDLPEEFDWRKKDGQNYVDPVISQSCGSCYAVSTVSMINSRVRIQTKNREKPVFPYHQVLSCDHYNQACAGGYPYLVEKYVQDYGLTKSGKCAQSQEQLKELGEGAGEHEAAVRITKFGYIGGYYGGSKTAQMMREVYENGPIVVGINGGYELMHYSEGLFIETGEGEGQVKNDFERVDHAVLVVGWGSDEGGKKHWIIKNSYGPNWGEHGYFRIPLGGDQRGITSLTSSGMPVLGDSNYFNEETGSESATEPQEGAEAKQATSSEEQVVKNFDENVKHIWSKFGVNSLNDK